jgi:hypothetical protein
MYRSLGLPPVLRPATEGSDGDPKFCFANPTTSMATIRIMAPKISIIVIATASLALRPSSAFSAPQTSVGHQRYKISHAARTGSQRSKISSALQVATAPPTDTSSLLGPRIPINESFPGAKRVHSNPDIFVIENFLDDDACQDIIDKASAKGDMAQSPVAYAGWTSDFKDLTELGELYSLR